VCANARAGHRRREFGTGHLETVTVIVRPGSGYLLCSVCPAVADKRVVLRTRYFGRGHDMQPADTSRAAGLCVSRNL
jgi:hypothetical protein